MEATKPSPTESGNRLRVARVLAGLGVEQAATAAGVTRQQWNRYESGKGGGVPNERRSTVADVVKSTERALFDIGVPHGTFGATGGIDRPGRAELPVMISVPTVSMLEAIGRASVAIDDIYRLMNVNFSDLPAREVNEFGHRYREARLAAGLSEAEAAMATGERTGQSVQHIEHGAIRPHQMDADRRAKMAKGLKTTIAHLFAGFPLPPEHA